MKTSKKLLALVLAAAMMVCMLAGCGSSASEAPASAAAADSAAGSAAPAASGDKVIKIGVFEPASGDNGAGGKQETLGIQYANQECPTVEIGGETYTVELDIVDNQSSTDKAPSAAQQLVNDGCSIVLGSYGSGVSIAASDIFKNGGVPAMGVTCTNPQVTEGNDHYFRICFLDPFQGTVLANYAYNTLGARKAYSLSKLGDDYSVGVCNYFDEAFKALGGEIVSDQFPDGNTDFTSYVSNAKSSACDVFFAPVSIEAAANIIDQVYAQGLTIPLLASDTWDSNVVAEAATGKDLSISVTTFYQEGANTAFDEGFKKWLNSDSTAMANNGGNDMIAAVSAMGYDAYYTALEALKAAGSPDPAAVMAALPGVTYTGVSGNIAFGENGDANRNSAIIKKVNCETGVWEFVSEATVE
ncbi:MAG: ABC transporter substrate-binding protein [Oscillospiraceae bacterium]|nr:ABC transporter substrate-binding protein [Oscillospiraceae bacterium]